ncbi:MULTISPECIES: MptD family putative ECF transporter S component [Gordonibacter]|uniref:MptD family putative ECF transporter S component n=1 Tax=Gordonibacter faecis TaxID=3047475 RepID=A0ABT7DIN5_9ACTN|nr:MULTISPECIES: MptD family putative ECF transporter S component [unclassified Gordonibacter]MDJ1649391.1 MptD family putative ECF transporter S component [Gordonibacter sp. KGMB12511]HIW75142.1 MptD family putative ECF transporter S component [Candidatus Gordonibacter avicola]
METTTTKTKTKVSTKAAITGRTAGRMTGRDYVLVALFGVLLFAVFMACSMVFSANANMAWFTHTVGAVPGGIVWTYVLARVPKRGAVAVMSVLVGALGLLMGMFWTGPVGIVVGGLVAELVLGAPTQRTATKRIVAFAAFVLCFWAGQISLIFIAGQTYVDMCVAMGLSAEYGQQLVDFVYGPLCLVAACTTVIGSVAGGLLGEKLFKKHFARMGA